MVAQRACALDSLPRGQGRLFLRALGVMAMLCAPILARAHTLDLTILDLTLPQLAAAPTQPLSQPFATATAASPNVSPDDGSIAAYFAHWFNRIRAARASQPEWSSPVVTTTALLEERFRFDAAFQHSGNGADTTALDGGRGLDLIVSGTEEVQVASAPYATRTSKSGKGQFTGFGDWPFLRFKQRLASSPESEGNYVLSAWLQVQAPVGVTALTNRAWTLLPTLGYGKGWGPFDIQGTVGAVIPTAYEGKTGTQVVNTVAFQYHVLGTLWPQLEVNWTYYPDGQRGGKSQVFLTPGLVVGRLSLSERLKFTIGIGYQSAVTPSYRASPLTPAYNHAWIATSRLSF